MVGLAWGLRTLEHQRNTATYTVMAVVATTAELTYGEEWLSEFIEEASQVMRDHPDLIEDRVKRLQVQSFIRDRVQALTKQYLK